MHGGSDHVREVERAFPDLAYMRLSQAAWLEAFLRDAGLSRCIELGFYHGKGSAFIAAMLEERGCGHLVTIDKKGARSLTPDIATVLNTLGLSHRVTWYYEPRSYTWRLMKLLQEAKTPRFDFCYIDGGHSWDNSGYAFFLLDRLLEPGGWMVFDDLDWTFSRMLPDKGTTPDWLAETPPEEVATAQVRQVWELLVKRHPNYDVFFEEGQWGVTRKKP